MAQTLQHQAAAQRAWLQTTSARIHHPVAGKANHELTFKPDQSGGAGQAVEHIKMLGVPVYPGPLFGLVIAFGLYRWGKVSWWAAVLALVVTLGAWIAAVRGFHIVTDDAARNIYLGGLVAGAIGAAGTMLGGAITLPSLRRLPDWLLILGVGAAAGLLIGPEPDNNLMLLFIVWQAVVAGCFGYALTRR